MNFLEDKRKETIKVMIRNYYKQVKIVGFTSLSLKNYLKNIGLNEMELKYALSLTDHELIKGEINGFE